MKTTYRNSEECQLAVWWPWPPSPFNTVPVFISTALGIWDCCRKVVVELQAFCDNRTPDLLGIVYFDILVSTYKNHWICSVFYHYTFGGLWDLGNYNWYNYFNTPSIYLVQYLIVHLKNTEHCGSTNPSPCIYCRRLTVNYSSFDHSVIDRDLTIPPVTN